MKGLGPARFSLARPSETPAVWLGSLSRARHRATVVCSHELQSCRYFLTKFLCPAVCSCIQWRKLWRQNMDESNIKNNRRSTVFSYFFLGLKNLKGNYKTQSHPASSNHLTCLIFCRRISAAFFMQVGTLSGNSKAKSHLFAISSVFSPLWWPRCCSTPCLV